jgi:hypothetical protein
MNFGEIVTFQNGERAVIVHTRDEFCWIVKEGSTATILSNLRTSEIKKIKEENYAEKSMSNGDESKVEGSDQ